MEDNKTKGQDSKNEEQQIRGVLYKEDDINMILKTLQNSKPDFDNIELFFLLKKILLNPIAFECEGDLND